MDRVGKKVLENPEIAEKILHDFDPAENIDIIIQYDVLNSRQLEEVRAERVPYKRKDLFYDFVKKAPDGYRQLLRVLREKDYYWLAEPLIEERTRVELSGGGRFVLDDFSATVRDMRLNERQLLQLAGHLGTKWEHIALQLDFKEAQLYDIKMQNQYVGTEMLATKMLVKLSQRDPSKSKLNYLIPLLEDNDIFLEKKDIENVIQ